MKTPLNTQQAAIVADICTTYPVEPDDIIFFPDDPDVPFFGYEASCILLNRLTKIIEIELEPVAPVSSDSINRRCRLVFEDGTSTFIAAANLKETGEDGQPLSTQQLEWLADSRAIRGAIRAKGINLLKLYWASKENADEVEFKHVRPQRSSALAQAHALGQEVGLINGDNKSQWYHAIQTRYPGRLHAGELTDAELADFIAFQRALRPKAFAAASVADARTK